MSLSYTWHHGHVSVAAREAGEARCVASVGRRGYHAACGYRARWTVTVKVWGKRTRREFPSCGNHAKLAQRDAGFCVVEGKR